MGYHASALPTKLCSSMLAVDLFCQYVCSGCQSEAIQSRDHTQVCDIKFTLAGQVLMGHQGHNQGNKVHDICGLIVIPGPLKSNASKSVQYFEIFMMLISCFIFYHSRNHPYLQCIQTFDDSGSFSKGKTAVVLINRKEKYLKLSCQFLLSPLHRFLTSAQFHGYAYHQILHL